MRWHFRDAGLLWLFVPAYIIHVAEEWFGGFVGWVARFAGRPLPADAFLWINGIAVLLLIAAIRTAIHDYSRGWLAVAIATIVLVNTAAHAAGAAITQSYSPGLISAVVLYVPLGALTLIRAIDQATTAQVTRGIVAGLVIHAAAFVVAFAATQFG